jgi:uncharacterized phage-associated protein
MSYSPIKVANEFLRLARETNPPIPLTPLKLLKLVYIAHGWSLHLLHQPLISETAEAWQYGPVVPSLYRAVRTYRSAPVDRDIPGDYDEQQLGDNERQLIAAVLNSYGHLSGTQLSNMTHMPDTPWSSAWNNEGRNSLIPNDCIERHYAELAIRRQGQRT